MIWVSSYEDALFCMDYTKKYKKRIDEIEEYMEYLATMFDEIQTPENNTLDEIKTPTDNDIDAIATPNNNDLDAIKTPANYDTDLKVATKKRRTRAVEETPIISSKKIQTIKVEVEDWLEDYLLYAYIEGTDALGQMLSVDAKVNEDEMARAVNNDKALGMGSWRESLINHLDGGNIGLAKNLAESEFHRVFNTAILDSAQEFGGKTKTWETMLDERVRDQHQYLEGLTIPLEEKFFTYDGDSGMFPGDFQTAENNCNCRCVVKIS